MNSPLPEPGRTSDEQRVVAMMTAVERLVAERRDAEAQRLLGEAAAILPEHPLVLHEHARRLSLAGDAAGALKILERVVGANPRHVPFLLSKAAVLRVLGRREEELAALDQALAVEPRHLVALLQKAALLDVMQKPRSAATVYGRAMQTLGPTMRLPAPIQAHVAHAKKRIAENSAQVAQLLESRLRALPGAGADAAARKRIDRCIDRMLGRVPIYTPEPTSMLFPFLANFEYYAREFFPWLEALEAQTGAIREELVAVLNSDGDGIVPYVEYPDGVPLDQWRELNNSRRWGAYFLWNQGRREEAHIERCPRTAAALAGVPRVDIPGRGPTAFFSILDARTHIPPHTGVTNSRLTAHLPLIVPPGCRFRVGGETRDWREGTAWVFDDSIEHEAWNDSDAPRAILLFDVWNPQLTDLERDMVREATVVFTEYNEVEGPVHGLGV
jgi:aspartyl/asparaginyl beta-hydroxylase (cupin superfamily)